MNVKRVFASAVVLWAVSGPAAFGQTFVSGSDGTDGPLVVNTNTELPLPPDGIFNYTTIDVATNATLTFTRNALNTPVYLLATGDVTIQGTIDVSGGTGTPVVGGLGGPGGFDGGTPGWGATGEPGAVPPGAGLGPGGGKGGENNSDLTVGVGRGIYGVDFGTQARVNDGSVHGSRLLIPLVGGSGGGGTTGTTSANGTGGGAGGGAILIASSTRVQIDSPGRVTSSGGTGSNSNGSGGAIRIVAPVVAGNGQLRVGGGGSTNAGRMRVDTIDRSQFNLSTFPSNKLALGTVMVVFPSAVPRLDVIEVAGSVIPEGNADPVRVLLPFGSPTSQTVTVQGRDFTGLVPITVAVIPESGLPVLHDTQIDMGLGNPSQVVVNVVIPVNNVTHIMAWTR